MLYLINVQCNNFVLYCPSDCATMKPRARLDASRQWSQAMQVRNMKAGTPNRRTDEISELLKALGCDPIEGMAKIAADPENRPELRGRMFAGLAQYLYPKRKDGGGATWWGTR